MKLLGIIVNFRTPDMTMEAARGLAAAIERIPAARFVIVDNHSEDGSFDKLKAAVAREAWHARCEVLASPKNGGFGAGNNFAIRKNLESRDPAEYFYLLNSDAVPRVDAVETLVEFMDNHRYAGIAGGYVHGQDDEPHQTAFRYPSLFAEFEEQAQTGPISKLLSHWIVALPIPDHTIQVDWTAAVSMIIRQSVLRKVGLFDEEFFLYFEETDLCRRAALAGFPTYYVRESEVEHLGSASTGMKDMKRPMPAYWFNARKHYIRKHHGRSYLIGANLAWMAGRTLRGVRRTFELKRDRYGRPRMTRDFVVHNFLPERLKGP
jgi:N-acetylglucosaminyl-diphospho-decaprenol L-rhamnosyltransferase